MGPKWPWLPLRAPFSVKSALSAGLNKPSLGLGGSRGRRALLAPAALRARGRRVCGRPRTSGDLAAQQRQAGARDLASVVSMPSLASRSRSREQREAVLLLGPDTHEVEVA